MVRRKISDKVEGIVVGLLKTKHTYRSIQNELKAIGYSISVTPSRTFVIILDINAKISMLAFLCQSLDIVEMWPHRTSSEKSIV